MIRYFIAFAVILAVVKPIGLEAQASGREQSQVQPQREKTGDTKLAGQYLKTMLTNLGVVKKPEPVRVSFSRAWVDAQPVAGGDAQWGCLSEALYFEARGETVKGQFAVAEVIMNRVKSSRFPDNVCSVIKQGTGSGRKFQCQFSYNCNGRKNVIYEKEAYARVSKVARAVLDGVEGVGNLTDGATHYHTTAVRPAWARTYTKTVQIGVHVFYRHNYRTAQNN
jgi:cell wall hydrolase